jgi:hypothetical protein
MSTHKWIDGGHALLVPKCGIRADGTHLVLGRGENTLTARTQLVDEDLTSDLAMWAMCGDQDRFRLEAGVTAPGTEAWQGSVCIRAPFENSQVEIHSTIAMFDSKEQDYLWKAIPQCDDFYAIQLVPNSRQNLNVAGDGNYRVGTQIFSWRWNDGAPNELWKIIWLTDGAHGKWEKD